MKGTTIFVLLDLGELIKSVALERRISAGALAEKINTSKQNIYGIYRRNSIDTELLTKICKALDYDFFQHFSAPYNGIVSYREYPEIENLERQLRDTEEKYELLKALYETETGKRLPFKGKQKK